MDQVRQYQILDRIDSGAEYVVYLGKDSRSDRKVAIRLVRLHDFVAAEHVDEFQSQLNADLLRARKLIHPAVVTDYEVFEEFGLTWVVMELVDGETLEDLLRTPGALGCKQALGILHQVADCLDHAHEMGVIHGDLKARYVVVDASGAVRVLSFGLRRLEELAAASDNASERAELFHLAPEQWGEGEVGPTADQYGLAALAYRMLAGDPEGEHVRAAVANPSLGDAAGAVIDRALTADPRERFQNCSEFVRCLAEALRSQGNWRTAGAFEEEDDEPEHLEFESEDEERPPAPAPALPAFASGELGQLSPVGPLPDAEFEEISAVGSSPTPWPEDFVREDWEQGPTPQSGGGPRRGVPLPWVLAGSGTVILAVVVAFMFWRANQPAEESNSPIAFQTAALPTPVVGEPFSHRLSLEGGTSPYRFEVSSGRLPPGLELDDASGEIRGVPDAAGSYPFAVTAEDAAGEVVTVKAELNARAGVALVSESVTPSGVVGERYEHQLAAEGGQPPYTWSINEGRLPPGLEIDTEEGVVAGTPEEAGTFGYHAKVADATGAAAEGQFQLEIGSGLTITTAPQLPPGVSTSAYAADLDAAGSDGSVTWGIVDGSLPPGLTLAPNSGAIRGRATRDGTFEFTARATDARGSSAERAFTLRLVAGLRMDTDGAIDPGVVGGPYQFPFRANGGRQPYQWSIADGELPDGLYLDAATGTLRGTPERAGRYRFSVAVLDALGGNDSQSMTLVVSDGLSIVGEASLPPAERGAGYAARLTAEGGREPLAWTLLDGRLPPGLSLSVPTGQITGIPETEGRFRFTVGVSDSGSELVSREFTLEVTPRLAINGDPVLPNAELNETYSHKLEVRGGSPPFRWSVVTGQLPPGLALGENSGVISGRPARPGVFRFRVQARMGASANATQEFTLTVAESGAGRLVWTGELPANTVLTISDGDVAPTGQLEGRLPGVPVTVSLQPADLHLVTAPGPGNGWRRLVIHSGARPREKIVISWRIVR